MDKFEAEISYRPIEPSDTARLIAAHDRLSDEARRSRFFRPHPVLTEKEADYFTNVDHVQREAFVAVANDQIIAVGRYDVVAPGTAEVAFVVGDIWQGHGIATTLLNLLADRARQVGIETFVADTFGDNRAMMAVFRHWAPQRKVTLDAGFLHVEMPIPQTAA